VRTTPLLLATLLAALAGCTRFHVSAPKATVPVSLSGQVCGAPGLWCDGTKSLGTFTFVEEHWSLLWGLVPLSNTHHDVSQELSRRAADAGADAIVGVRVAVPRRDWWAFLATLLPILPVRSRVEVSGDLVQLREPVPRDDFAVAVQITSVRPLAADGEALPHATEAMVWDAAQQTLAAELQRSFQQQSIAPRGVTAAPVDPEIVAVVAEPAIGLAENQVDVSVETRISRGGATMTSRTYRASASGADVGQASANAFAEIWRRARYDVVASVARATTPTPGPDSAATAPTTPPPSASTVDQAELAASRAFFEVAPQPPGAMVGRKFYLCCSLSFDDDLEASDANYSYPADDGGTVLPADTEITVLEASEDEVVFTTGAGDPYTLTFEHGHGHVPAERYFGWVFRTAEGRAPLDRLPATSDQALQARSIDVGMTRVEAAVLRGLPPLHRTADPQSDEWLFYEDGDWGVYVTFEDSRITKLVRGPTP